VSHRSCCLYLCRALSESFAIKNKATSDGIAELRDTVLGGAGMDTPRRQGTGVGRQGSGL
jgi:hypothetical protein